MGYASPAIHAVREGLAYCVAKSDLAGVRALAHRLRDSPTMWRMP
jgi:hypothetical protein